MRHRGEVSVCPGQHGRRRIVLGAGIAGAVLCVSVRAQSLDSQSAAVAPALKPGDADVAEIVVTGEKRDTRLIDTPASVAVFDSAKIDRKSVV